MATRQSHHVRGAGEQRYRHLFEHIPICIFVADLSVIPATILEANRRAELVYGYVATELAGMPAVELVPEYARSGFLGVMQCVQRGETVMAEAICQHRDGSCFPVRVIAAPDPTDDGHMIVTVEEISAEKQRRSEADAIDGERRRIAHEIHDGVAQTLAGLRFKSALWSHLADAAPPGMRAALDELEGVLSAAIADLRRAIFALRPLDLEVQGFFPALAQLVADFGDQNQLLAQLKLSGSLEILPKGYELPLFRIIQEGLNNAGQHACASEVLVRVDVSSAGAIVVSLRDNGGGFDPYRLNSIDRNGHFGLRQMRERIVDLGGTLDIHSRFGQGTELAITFPPLTRQVHHGAG